MSYRCDSGGSRGSIVPAKENVHAEPMTQSTGTPAIFVPLSSAGASFAKIGYRPSVMSH